MKAFSELMEELDGWLSDNVDKVHPEVWRYNNMLFGALYSQLKSPEHLVWTTTFLGKDLAEGVLAAMTKWGIKQFVFASHSTHALPNIVWLMEAGCSIEPYRFKDGSERIGLLITINK